MYIEEKINITHDYLIDLPVLFTGFTIAFQMKHIKSLFTADNIDEIYI